MKNTSWSFLYDATTEELKMVVEALRKADDKTKLSYNASCPEILDEIKLRTKLLKYHSYKDFIQTIGKAINCPEVSWDNYENVLLTKILTEEIKRTNNNSFNQQIAKALNLSNTSTKALCNEINARSTSSEEFKSSLPFFLSSMYGIKWEKAITALPTLASITGISTLLSATAAIPAIIPGLGLLLGGAIGVLGATVAIFGPFGNSFDINKILPVVPVLILINQEHNSSFNSSKDAITYVDNEIRLQSIFKERSYAALSFILQIAQSDKNDNIAKYINKFEPSVLQKKRLPIPPYRLKKLLPFKNDIYESLMEWVIEDYQQNRLHFSLTEKEFSSFYYDLLGKSFSYAKEPKIKEELISSKTEEETNDHCSNRIQALLPVPNNIDTQNIKKGNALNEKYATNNTHSLIEAFNQEVKRLQEEILKQKALIEEYKETFAFLRHDIAAKYAASVRPLYTYRDTHKISDEDVVKAITYEEEVCSIIENVGLNDYGIKSSNTYVLTDLVKKKFTCNDFELVWNDQTNFSSRVAIPQATFSARVLGNLLNNIRRHAFPENRYKSIPKEEKIVEVYVSENPDCVTLSISNNGCPIAKNNISRIFDKGVCFGETAHSGQGLYYIKRFMEHWGGTVAAKVPNNNYNIEITLTFKK